MTRKNEKIDIVRKLVIVSDIRSSTSLLEDLKATDNLDRWRNLLINLKDQLIDNGRPFGIEMYKFIGDGWILLAPPNIDKGNLFEFLGDFSRGFEIGLDSRILELLSRTPDSQGLTFGIDTGDLVRVEMNEQIEYVGRPINVAARLQSEAKKQNCGYVALFSRNSLALTSGRTHDVLKPWKVSLKNISGGAEIDCFLYQVL